MTRFLSLLFVLACAPWGAAQERDLPEISSRRPLGSAPFPVQRQVAVPDHATVAKLLELDLPGGAFNPDDRPLESENDNTIDVLESERSVHEVFRKLRIALRRNILVDKDVDAKWGGDLYSVDPEEAIELICQSTGLIAQDMGSYIRITKAKPVTRIFTIKNLPAKDAELLIKPALSGEKAIVSSTVEAVTGLEDGEASTGGDAYANDGLLVVTDFPANLDAVQEILDRVDRTPKQVLIEVAVLSAALGSTDQLGVNFDALSGIDYQSYGATSANGFSITDNVFSSENLDDGLRRFSTGLANGLATRGSQFGFISGNIGAFVTALKEKTAVSIHANTSVTVLNKHLGSINLNNRDGYKTSTTAENGTTTEEVEYLETGAFFRVRPFIMSHDLVRMELYPEDSNGGINEDGLPSEETANMKTNVAVRSGETLVIGGLFRERRVSTKGRVPGVGDIPGVGYVFRSNNEFVVREELIFLITPRIIDLEAEARFTGARERHPHARRGADRTVIDELYTRSARALALETEYGCALAVLEAVAYADPAESDPKHRDLQARITRGLVPEFSSRSVDARLLDSLKRQVLSGR